MTAATIKARRDYIDRNGYLVRVTGFELVNGERWCRVRFPGRRVSTLLMHPSSIISQA